MALADHPHGLQLSRAPLAWRIADDALYGRPRHHFGLCRAQVAAIGFKPFDMAFSFVIGVYGLVTLAIVALLILRDPIWRGKGGNLG
jgi:hypothetical protein